MAFASAEQQQQAISLADSEGWRRLTQGRDNNEQRFPGLEVQAEHADKSHKLKGSNSRIALKQLADSAALCSAVSEHMWRSAPENYSVMVLKFLEQLKNFLGEEGSPAVQACLDPDTSAFMLDFVTATKLYRQVPHLPSGQSKTIIQQAQDVFECLQLLVRDNGSFLMLRYNGWRVPRRIILFSRPSEIVSCCHWLFEQQPALHEGFKTQMSPYVHGKCADLLAATIGQLLNYDDQLQAEYCKPLQALKDHFARQECSRCFGALVKQQVDLVLMKCGAEHEAHQQIQKGIYTAPRPASQSDSAHAGLQEDGAVNYSEADTLPRTVNWPSGMRSAPGPAPPTTHASVPFETAYASNASYQSGALPPQVGQRPAPSSQIGPASSDNAAVSQAENLLASLALSEQPSRFDVLILEGIESLVQGFMGGLASYTSRETQVLKKVQQVALRRFLELSEMGHVLQPPSYEASVSSGSYSHRPSQLQDSAMSMHSRAVPMQAFQQRPGSGAAAAYHHPHSSQDAAHKAPSRADMSGRWK